MLQLACSLHRVGIFKRVVLVFIFKELTTLNFENQGIIMTHAFTDYFMRQIGHMVMPVILGHL